MYVSVRRDVCLPRSFVGQLGALQEQLEHVSNAYRVKAAESEAARNQQILLEKHQVGSCRASQRVHATRTSRSHSLQTEVESLQASIALAKTELDDCKAALRSMSTTDAPSGAGPSAASSPSQAPDEAAQREALVAEVRTAVLGYWRVSWGPSLSALVATSGF